MLLLRLRSKQSMQFVRMIDFCSLITDLRFESNLKKLRWNWKEKPTRRWKHTPVLIPSICLVSHNACFYTPHENQTKRSWGGGCGCCYIEFCSITYYSMQARSYSVPSISWSFFLSTRFTTITSPYRFTNFEKWMLRKDRSYRLSRLLLLLQKFESKVCISSWVSGTTPMECFHESTRQNRWIDTWTNDVIIPEFWRTICSVSTKLATWPLTSTPRVW